MSVLVTALQSRWSEHSHYDPAEADLCRRPPSHSPKAPIFTVNLVGFAQMVGFW